MKDIRAFEPIWENWVIDEKLGEGSFGTVWKAHREDQFSHVRQEAAVKHISIPKEPNDDDISFSSEDIRGKYYRSQLDQLIIEIDAMVSLKGKPNIVSYEEHKVVPKENNSGYDLFLRMELLTSLPKYIKDELKRSLSRAEVIKLGIDIATALEVLEDRSFVHRDIKPFNIFRDKEGNYKLGDFGTARVLEGAQNASTRTGTPNYMAPEVYAGLGQYDQTVDIYSLGIMLYRYMNNNSLPFISDVQMEQEVALQKRMRGEVIPPPCNADPELSRIILKACAFDPKERYQTAKEMKRDLVKALEWQPAEEIEIPVVCRMEDGTEIDRSSKKGKPGSKVKITKLDTPYKRFEREEKNLASASEIIVTIDENGKADPPEAVFIWRESRTIFQVSIEVICLDENRETILKQKVDCYSQTHNAVKAPVIPDYTVKGPQEVEVDVLENHTTRPPEVVFEYQKERKPQPPSVKPVECDVPILCVLENGKEILRSKRTCRENAENIVTAPDITGYMLTGNSSEKVKVSHDKKLEPDKVVFSYKELPDKKTGAVTEKKKSALKPWMIGVIACTAIAVIGLLIWMISRPEKKYDVTWVNADGAVLEIDQGLKSGTIPEYNGETPTKAADDQYTYVFNAWSPSVSPVNADATYTAVYTEVEIPIKKFAVTWVNDDGSVLEADQDLTAGAIPEYNGAAPTKASDDQYTYTFDGWTPSVSPVSADTTYTAVYAKEKKPTPTPKPVVPTASPIPSYQITWQDEAGNTIEKTEAAHGVKPSHGDVTKAADAQYSYLFAGWDPEITEATQDAVYTARFERIVNNYTITWQDETGKEIDRTEAAYGAMPNHLEPVKEADQQYTYSFSGWDPIIEKVTGDAVYKATYKATVKTYTITWLDDAGNVIDTTQAAYGTVPTHQGLVKKADEQYTYTFSNWEPKPEAVTEDAVYQAAFISTINSYSVIWLDDAGKIIDTTEVDYGAMPTHQAPVKKADQQFTYTFSGWEPALKKVTGNAVYQAAYEITENSYTITWKDDAGLPIDTAELIYGAVPSHEDPVKEPDQQYTYQFSGWEPTPEKVTGDASYKATYIATPNSYKITWQDETGNTIDTTEAVYGTIPTHQGPVKESDQQYTYTFIGWNPAIKRVTGDASYKAMYISIPNSYKITWQDETGKTIDTTEIAYGTMPKHQDPVKKADAQYTYKFSGWDPALEKVTGDAEYKATFKATVNSYTIIWKDETGKTIDTTKAAYGTMPKHQDPVKESDAQYTYDFSGWEPKLAKVTGTAEYKATFKTTVNSYTITWKDAAGKTIDTTEIVYGTTPKHQDPVKKADAQYTYKFSGWEPKLAKVTGDAVYKATFKATVNSYTIIWKDETGKTIDTAKVDYGTMPTHQDPVKESDAQYTYQFSGWEPALEKVTGTAEYKATFKTTVNSYTITWKDAAGKTIDTTKVAYGTMPKHQDPVKKSDAQYTYKFSGWEPKLAKVTGDTVYKATFKATVNSYTITWKDDTGKVIDTTKVAYGTMPTHQDPVKKADAQYTYKFSGWKPALENVTGDAEYKATFKTTVNSYTITWKDDAGKVIDTTKGAYGTMPTHQSPVKEADESYTYTFSGWSPTIKTITGDASYKAVFDKTTIPTPQPKWICWSCGEENEERNNFCVRCAAPRNGKPPETPAPTVTEASDSEGWICSNCQAHNSFDDTFCTNCAQTKLCLECGYSVPKDDKFCPNCATEVGKWVCWQCKELQTGNNAFCDNCAAKRHTPGKQ